MTASRTIKQSAIPFWSRAGTLAVSAGRHWEFSLNIRMLSRPTPLFIYTAVETTSVQKAASQQGQKNRDKPKQRCLHAAHVYVKKIPKLDQILTTIQDYPKSVSACLVHVAVWQLSRVVRARTVPGKLPKAGKKLASVSGSTHTYMCIYIYIHH